LRDDGDEAPACGEVERVEIEGRGLAPDPALGTPSSARASAASAAFVATALRPNGVWRPAQSVNTPPASRITGNNAAVSQSARMPSSITSARPVATRRYP
jgi:hypothetical protein